MSKFQIAYNVTPTAIVFMIDSRTFTVNKGDERYKEVREAIRTENFESIPDLLDLKGRLVTESNGGIYLLNGMLRCDKYDIPATLATRIVEMFRQGFSTERLTMFLDNLHQNPNESGTVIEELYDFLEHCNLPLTADGCFLAYKMVRPDFTDLYTGKMDNSVGAIVEMDRDRCDTNRGNECSRGLHFCSEGYLGKYGTRGSDQVVIVKVNPRDVTSIPRDYNFAKGRACVYEIVEAIGWDDLIKPLFTNDHSENVKDESKSEVVNETPWELRNSNDQTLVDAFVTRQAARDARNGDPNLYILYTKTGEVVAGKVNEPAPEPELKTEVKANPSAVLDEKKVREIRKILAGGHYDTIAELALMYGVSDRTIRRIRDGESWTHVVV